MLKPHVFLGLTSMFVLACGTGAHHESSRGGSGGDGGGGATTSTSHTDASSSSAGLSVPEGEAFVHYIGRFDRRDPAGPRFSWPGSAIAARFSGTGVHIRLHDEGTNFFTVIIDDEAPRALSTSSASDTYELASGLAPGVHSFWLEKRTEAYVGAVQLLDLQVEGGAIVPSPRTYARRIEMIGDSITAGYGDLGDGPNCGFSADTEDESVAYGALAAGALGAEHTSIAYSGIGVYRANGGSTDQQMPVRFQRALADDPTSGWDWSWVPDVVVVNLGTNDFSTGDPGQPYIDAYNTFAQQIRGRYPRAFLVLAVGPMLSDYWPPGGNNYTKALDYAKSVAASRHAAGDMKVSVLDLGVQDTTSGLGCDWHPGLAEQQKMADMLATEIRARMGW